MRTPAVLLSVTLLIGVLTGPAVAGPVSVARQSVAPTSVPSPTVTGPIPAGARPGDPSHDYPFFATDQDLRAYGYVEQEFFLEGTASGHHYKTRMVVRRPVSPRKFNGTAIVEWYNVTNTFDYEVIWSRSFRHMLEAGYVWVGVSAQASGVHSGRGLKAWNPSRYGSLDLTAGGTVTDDSLCYEVFSQAAQALRHPVGANPVPGLDIGTLIATGQSQSASRLTTYANETHAAAPIYDAIAIIDGGVQLRTDLTTKIFKTASEYDVLSNQAARRQPDTDRFVYWEIAGASHSDRHAYLVNNPIRLRDAGVSGLLAGPTAPCVAPARSNVPYEYVLDAMFDHIVRWARQGIQPPAAPKIEVTDTTTRPAVAVRDPYQIIQGGIRLAAVAAPTERNTGWNAGLTPDRDSACQQGGTWIPFDGTTLRTLYPTHASYVHAVRQATEQNLRDGFLVRDDAEATIHAAERADVP